MREFSPASATFIFEVRQFVTRHQTKKLSKSFSIGKFAGFYLSVFLQIRCVAFSDGDALSVAPKQRKIR